MSRLVLGATYICLQLGVIQSLLSKGNAPRNTALWGLVANRSKEGSGSLAVPDGKLC